jgi:porin
MGQDTACADAPCPAFAVSAGYTADLRRNMSGGLEQGNAASGLFELGASWTTDRLLPGAWVITSASLIHTGGAAISGRYVGDLQGLNNIEAPAGLRLYELWSEIRFGERGTVSTRMGFLDLNAEFDAPVTSGFFIGPPFGIGTDLAQTGENGPAVFPYTSLGVRIAGRLGDTLLWRAAAFDGLPGSLSHDDFVTVNASHRQGALLIGELEYARPGFNKLAIGAWSYTASFELVDAAALSDQSRHKGNRGAYAMADLPLGSLRGTRFDAMLRLGAADGRYNAIDGYVGAALVASHLSSRRPDDAVGLAVAHGRTSSHFRRALAFEGGAPLKSETQVELTWRAPLRGWLNIVPSVQWVDNPGADGALRDAFIAGLRFEMSFDHEWPLLARQGNSDRNAPLVMTAP